jgi:hypothetical protein
MYVEECQNQLKKMVSEMKTANEKAMFFEKMEEATKVQLHNVESQNKVLLARVKESTEAADRMEGERNAYKQKAKALKQDMSKIFRACGGCV